MLAWGRVGRKERFERTSACFGLSFRDFGFRRLGFLFLSKAQRLCPAKHAEGQQA